MKYYNFFVLIKRKRGKKKELIKDKVKMERETETKIERQMIFATNASQTKESKIIAIAIAKPRRV